MCSVNMLFMRVEYFYCVWENSIKLIVITTTLQTNAKLALNSFLFDLLTQALIYF